MAEVGGGFWLVPEVLVPVELHRFRPRNLSVLWEDAVRKVNLRPSHRAVGRKLVKELKPRMTLKQASQHMGCSTQTVANI